MYNICLFGENIKYSKSPYIHNLFSKEIKINYFYYINETNKYEFKSKLLNFLLEDGYGANITVPFKEDAFNLCDKLTYNAKISRSVNTVKKDLNNKIIGENTDCMGILFDLKRLNYINKYEKKNILIIGSGGASKSIIPILYKNGCNIFLTNRTYDKSYELKEFLKKQNIYINILNINNLILKNESFNIIVNATSSGINNDIPKLNKNLINKNILIYDLFYNIDYDTPFIKWCKSNGSVICNDGLGMLVAQAAYSCLFWYNKMPNINKIINLIKNRNKFK